MGKKWFVMPSLNDPEMFAVAQDLSVYEIRTINGYYIVADKLPIEDATLIAAVPDMLEALESAFQLIPSLSVVQWPPGHALKREVQEKIRLAILKAKGGA